MEPDNKNAAAPVTPLATAPELTKQDIENVKPYASVKEPIKAEDVEDPKAEIAAFRKEWTGIVADLKEAGVDVSNPHFRIVNESLTILHDIVIP